MCHWMIIDYQIPGIASIIKPGMGTFTADFSIIVQLRESYFPIVKVLNYLLSSLQTFIVLLPYTSQLISKSQSSH